MQSGRGEEAADGAYRPMPIPHEPQASAVPEAREGVVLPAHGEQHGEQWPQPNQVVQPAPGQPWGAPQHAPQQPSQPQSPQGFQPPHGVPQHPGGGEATQLLPPYGQQSEAPHAVPPHGQESEATQFLPPYGEQSEATQFLPPYGQQSEATQLLTPYPQESEATQLLTPYGQQAQAAPGAEPPAPDGESEKTQLIAPMRQQPVELPRQAAELRQPLPPEQQFQTPVPPPPAQPPAAGVQTPPMPSAAPYSIRPGAPGDQPPEERTQLLTPQQPGAPATEQLPRFNEAWQSQPQGATAHHAEQAPPQARDDYDFLYRKDGDPGAARPPHSPSYGNGMPPQPPYTQQPARDFGQDAPERRAKFGKLSPMAMIGIGVAGLAVIGVAVGAALSGGSDNSGDQQKAGVASPAAGGGANGAADAAQAQAKQLDSLLKDSNSSRATVISAVASIKSCSNMGQSSADLRTAASQRAQLITRLDQLTLDKLPNHDELVKQLTAAWKASAEADNDYADWGDQVSKDKKGCDKGHAKGTPAAQKGNAASGRATFAKKKAADLWNPIAGQYGLTQRQFTDL
ncbi:hypothetical protein [Streptomyces sp. RPT161]|uniref:hypothetical protein n=1 Tax=Streptomyces sp. RPT161 TaxID=3015993 RepID=UPI0022B8A8F6|nr:hypothetical protein [Streptomyces sp. RPT161]